MRDLGVPYAAVSFKVASGRRHCCVWGTCPPAASSACSADDGDTSLSNDSTSIHPRFVASRPEPPLGASRASRDVDITVRARKKRRCHLTFLHCGGAQARDLLADAAERLGVPEEKQRPMCRGHRAHEVLRAGERSAGTSANVHAVALRIGRDGVFDDDFARRRAVTYLYWDPVGEHLPQPRGRREYGNSIARDIRVRLSRTLAWVRRSFHS